MHLPVVSTASSAPEQLHRGGVSSGLVYDQANMTNTVLPQLNCDLTSLVYTDASDNTCSASHQGAYRNNLALKLVDGRLSTTSSILRRLGTGCVAHVAVVCMNEVLSVL